MRDQNGFPGRIAHFRVIIMMANDHDRHSTASWSSGRMTTHGVDALVAITCRSAIDDPSRFAKSQTVVASFGLTPKKYQSGETNLDGGIRVGDTMVRTTFYRGGSHYADPCHQVLCAETMGSRCGKTAGYEARRGGA
jgi:hypothetical protein